MKNITRKKNTLKKNFVLICRINLVGLLINKLIKYRGNNIITLFSHQYKTSLDNETMTKYTGLLNSRLTITAHCPN